MKIRLGMAVAVVAGGMGWLTPAAGGLAEPCCNVKSVNTRTLLVTVTDKSTGCAYEFQAKTAADLADLKVGADIRLDVKGLIDAAEPAGRSAGLGAKPAEPVARPSEPINDRPASPVDGRPKKGLSSASAPATSAACGSNVARNAKTKTLCKRMTGPNSWEWVPC